MHKRGVYTPQISRESAFVLRRIAWAAGMPMTTTLDSIIEAMVPWIKQRTTCSACRDPRCEDCLLQNHSGDKPVELDSLIRKTRRSLVSKSASHTKQ